MYWLGANIVRRPLDRVCECCIDRNGHHIESTLNPHWIQRIQQQPAVTGSRRIVTRCYSLAGRVTHGRPAISAANQLRTLCGYEVHIKAFIWSLMRHCLNRKKITKWMSWVTPKSVYFSITLNLPNLPYMRVHIGHAIGDRMLFECYSNARLTNFWTSDLAFRI